MNSHNNISDIINCYNNSNNSTSKFKCNYPLLSTIVASGTLLTVAGIVNPKSRKIIVPTIKYIGKQQLKLFAGIGVLSLATIYSKNINSNNNENNIIVL